VNFPFEQDPRFAKLPYSDQQQLRLKFAAKQFGQDQRFLNLPETDKMLLLQKVQTLPPVFENPEVGAQFAQAAKNPVLYQTFANANKQVALGGIVLGMLSNVMPQAQVMKEMLYGGDAAKGTAYIQNLIDSSTSLSPITKMLPKLGTVGGFLADLYAYAVATGGNPIGDIAKLAGGFGKGGAARLAKLGGTLVGRESLSPTTVLGGVLQDTALRVTQNMAKLGKASGTTMQLARWGLADLAPHVARMAAMGATGVLRDQILMPALNGQGPLASLPNVAKTFGTYAAGDTLFWNALAWGGPFLKLAGTVLKSFGRSAEKVSSSLYVTDAAGKKGPMGPELMAAYEGTMNRGDLPPTLLETASPAVQDHINAWHEWQRWSENPELAARDPMGRTVMAAKSIGLDVVEIPTGFRVRHPSDPGVFVEVKTLGQLDEALTQYLRERKGLFNLDELRLDPLRGHLVRMMDAQDGITDALKAGRPSDAKASFVSLDKRPGISPVEAEGIKAGSFTGAGQNAVADTYHLPLSQATMEKFRTRKITVNEGQESYVRKAENSLLPSGSDAIPLSKEGGSPNVFASAGKVAPVEEFKAAQGWASRAIDAGSKEKAPILTATALRRAGYDAANLPDGSLLALYPDRQIKILDNSISPKTGKSGFKAPASIRQENVSVTLQGLKGSVPDAVVQGNNSLLGALLKDTSNTGNLSRAGSLLLKRLGAKDSRVAVTIIQDAKEVIVRKTKDGIRLLVPPGVKADEIVRKLADHVAGEGKATRTIKTVETTVSLPEDAQNIKNLKTWFAGLIEEVPAIKNWAARNAQGLDPLETIRKFAVADMTTQTLKVTMAKWGVRIVGGEGNLKAIKGGKVIATGKTGQELLDNSGIVLEKIPSKYAPKVVALSPDAVTFEVGGIGVKGGPKEIWKLLDNFEDISKENAAKKLVQGSEGSVSWMSQGVYRVQMPAYGVDHLVSSLEEARSFIGGEWKSWSNLSDRIESAGGVLRHENGKYVVYMAGGKREAANLQELGKVLKDIPEPSSLPELVGEDAHLYYKEGAPLLDFSEFRPRYVDKPPELQNPNFLSRISMTIKPYRGWVTTHAQKTGNIEVLKSVNDVDAGARLAFRDDGQYLELIDDMQKSLGGNRNRQMESAAGILYYMGETNPENRASIVDKFHLGDKEMVVVERLRAMLGKGPNDTGGLFAKFGMDPNMFIFNYMSRVRAAVDEGSILHLNQPEVTERVLEKAFGKATVPKELTAWFENMRSSDLISFALDTNAFSVMRKYITRGHLKLYTGEAWRTLVTQLNRPGMDPDLRWRTMRFLDMLQGGGFSDTEKMMQAWSSAFLKSIGRGKGEQAEAAHQDVLRTLYTLSYTAHLGWRPYNAIRNLIQMYQTVGPLVGNDYLKKSIQFAASKEGPAFYQGLQRLGVIKHAPPLINQLSSAEHILGKISGSSLAMFTTADDITRFVGYKAGFDKFNDGIKAFGTVDINNAKRFAEYVGTNLYGPEMNSRILEMTMAGAADTNKLASARHLYANAVNERALFLPRREQSPILFHGVIGKMFGQYGTFAAQYVSFVTQTWKYATPMQKAAFAARWIGNSTAMAAGVYALGMRARDWLPWSPAQFTGGPFFNLAIDLVHSIGQDYNARQARGELNRMLPIDLNKLIKGEGLEFQPPVGMPGYYQIRTLMKMQEYASKGDAWKSFLALMSAPIRSE
jgi:hypothetical protein